MFPQGRWQRLCILNYEYLSTIQTSSCYGQPHWQVLTGLCGIAALVMAVFLIASIVSTIQSVANEAQICEKNLENAISSDYGPRVHPVTGQQQSFHTGIDIATPIGTPVSSPLTGLSV